MHKIFRYLSICLVVILTAGATGGLANEFGIGMDAKTLKPVNTTDIVDKAKYAGFHTAIKTGTDVAIQDKSFASAFTDNLRSNASTQLQAAGASHLGHAYLNRDLSYSEHKALHAALGGATGAITGAPMEGGVGGLVGEVAAEAVVKARATELLDQMLERKITPEQLQTGLAKLRQDASDIAKLTGATTAFAGKMDIDATTASAGTAAENNAVTPLDALFIGADLAKVGVAYYQGDQALMEEAIKDLATDIIPGVPAGTSRVARLLASGAKGVYKHVDTKVAKENVRHEDSNQVKWVDENAGMSPEARKYNDSAMGARSNHITKSGQAPAIYMKDKNGKDRTVKFDGLEGSVLIDRKLSVVTTPKAKDQALRQSEALKQNNLKGRWEVPNKQQADRAQKMFKDLGINNIEVRITQ